MISEFSAINDANIPAKIAQNADVTPYIENGVAATTNAANAPNFNFPPKAVSSELCREDRIANPAKVTTKLRGNAPRSDVRVPAPSAMEIVKVDAIKFAQ